MAAQIPTIIRLTVRSRFMENLRTHLTGVKDIRRLPPMQMEEEVI
jgi:hypothetical protein